MDNHSSQSDTHSVRLLVSIILNGLITVAEVAGGILSGSLALVSDAIHNLSDTLALVLAWIANKIGIRQADTRRTFGYKRFEILSAFINAFILTALSLYLIYSAFLRLIEPSPIRSGLMFIVALAGLVVNLVSMLILRHGSKESLNIRAAYLHLLGDTLSSVAVIVGAVLIHYTGQVWIDPILTMIISVVIIRQAFRILYKSVSILMQSAPAGLDLEEVKNYIEKHPKIKNVHHVHCWQMEDSDIFFEAHIETVEDMKLSESGRLSEEICTLLQENFNIAHATLQVEYELCDDKTMIRQRKGK